MNIQQRASWFPSACCLIYELSSCTKNKYVCTHRNTVLQFLRNTLHIKSNSMPLRGQKSSIFSTIRWLVHRIRKRLALWSWRRASSYGLIWRWYEAPRRRRWLVRSHWDWLLVTSLGHRWRWSIRPGLVRWHVARARASVWPRLGRPILKGLSGQGIIGLRRE